MSFLSKLFKKKTKVFVALRTYGKTKEEVLELQNKVLDIYFGGEEHAKLVNPCISNNTSEEYLSVRTEKIIFSDVVVVEYFYRGTAGCDISRILASCHGIKTKALPYGWPEDTSPLKDL